MKKAITTLVLVGIVAVSAVAFSSNVDPDAVTMNSSCCVSITDETDQ